MDIHKPKAAHNLREFAIELGTIVCGILIALGLEQAVEWAHWQQEVAEQRERIEAERSSIVGAMNSRSVLEGCIHRRLEDVSTIIDRHDAGRPLNIIGPVGRPTYNSASTAAWTTAIANHAVSHMPAEEQANLADTYLGYEAFTLLTNNERDAWRSLQIIDYGAKLTPQEWSEVRRAFVAARDADVVIDLDLKPSAPGNWRQGFERVKPAPPMDFRGEPHVHALCQPMLKK